MRETQGTDMFVKENKKEKCRRKVPFGSTLGLPPFHLLPPCLSFFLSFSSFFFFLLLSSSFFFFPSFLLDPLELVHSISQWTIFLLLWPMSTLQLDLATVLPPSASSVTIFDTLESDGNFMIVHYLISSLSKNQPVVLVTLAQIFNHYSLAAKKLVKSFYFFLLLFFSLLFFSFLFFSFLFFFSFLETHQPGMCDNQGFNLIAARESGLLKVVDCVSNLHGWSSRSASLFRASFNLPSLSAKMHGYSFSDSTSQETGFVLTPHEGSSCRALYEQVVTHVGERQAPCIIVDDLSALSFTGIQHTEIVTFVGYLEQLTKKVCGPTLL